MTNIAPQIFRNNKKRALLALCFLTRLYNYEDDVLHAVEEEVVLKDLHKTFYINYEAGFCNQVRVSAR